MASVIHPELLTTRAQIPAWLKTCGYRKLAEIGVREGLHFKSLATANPVSMLGVDLWAADGIVAHNDKNFTQAHLDKMLADLWAWVQFQSFSVSLLRGDSAAKAAEVKDGFLDFVYLDADHTYEAVKRDIAAWWPKIRVGGTLSGHDYCKRTLPNGVTFGVVQAVNEFAAGLGIDKVHTTAPTDYYASWFITKT